MTAPVYTGRAAGRARLVLTTAAKATLITPVGDGDQDGSLAYRHLLMPIRCAG
jgi:hypothetical protein